MFVSHSPSPLPRSACGPSAAERENTHAKDYPPRSRLIALLTIATFWLSTVISELFLSEAAVVAVKTTLPWGFLLLIPALAAAGGSGFFLSHGQRTGLVGAKLKRMPFIAGNGLLILIPAALFLASKARAESSIRCSMWCRPSS